LQTLYYHFEYEFSIELKSDEKKIIGPAVTLVDALENHMSDNEPSWNSVVNNVRRTIRANLVYNAQGDVSIELMPLHVSQNRSPGF
jgi:hypothetical protein